jgi:hypothetical protein
LQAGYLHAQIKVFLFVAEYTSHTATSGIENLNVGAADQSKCRGSFGGANQCFLMAVRVKQHPSRLVFESK